MKPLNREAITPIVEQLTADLAALRQAHDELKAIVLRALAATTPTNPDAIVRTCLHARSPGEAFHDLVAEGHPAAVANALVEELGPRDTWTAETVTESWAAIAQPVLNHDPDLAECEGGTL